MRRLVAVSFQTSLDRAHRGYSESMASRFPRDRLVTVEEYFALRDADARRVAATAPRPRGGSSVRL